MAKLYSVYNTWHGNAHVFPGTFRWFAREIVYQEPLRYRGVRQKPDSALEGTYLSREMLEIDSKAEITSQTPPALDFDLNFH